MDTIIEHTDSVCIASMPRYIPVFQHLQKSKVNGQRCEQLCMLSAKNNKKIEIWNVSILRILHIICETPSLCLERCKIFKRQNWCKRIYQVFPLVRFTCPLTTMGYSILRWYVFHEGNRSQPLGARPKRIEIRLECNGNASAATRWVCVTRWMWICW